MTLKAKKRSITGKQVKSLRKAGTIPASVYGPSSEPLNLEVNNIEFARIFQQNGYSNLFDLQIEDQKPFQVLIKEVQVDPIKDTYLHVNFYQVNMAKEISAVVPVTVSGESAAVKNNIGLLVNPLQSVTVHCLPANLPSSLEISIDGLDNIGDSLLLRDIKLPQGVELDSSMSPETVLAYISAPQKQIVEETTTAAASEGEEKKEGETADAKEGEAKAE